MPADEETGAEPDMLESVAAELQRIGDLMELKALAEIVMGEDAPPEWVLIRYVELRAALWPESVAEQPEPEPEQEPAEQ